MGIRLTLCRDAALTSSIRGLHFCPGLLAPYRNINLPPLVNSGLSSPLSRPARPFSIEPTALTLRTKWLAYYYGILLRRLKP